MKNYVMGWRPCGPIPFDGGEIHCEILPLPREQVMKLTQFMKIDGDKMKLIATANELLNVADECIPGFVQNIRGFQIDNKDPDPKQICGSLVFQELIVLLLTELISISSLSKGEKENFARPSITQTLDAQKDTTSPDGPMSIGSTSSDSATNGDTTEVTPQDETDEQ